MRLLHVVPSYLPATRYGGPIYSVHALCAALVQRGHSVEVFTTNIDGPGVSDVPLGLPIERDGVRVTYFPVTFGRRLYRSPLMARALRARIAEFDVLHLHSVFLWPTTVAAHLARERGVPYVIAPRGMLVDELIRAKSPFVKRAWIALFEKRNLAEAAAVHVTSRIEADGIRSLGLEDKRIAVVPNGIDSPPPPAEDGEWRNLPRPFVLSLGRIDPKKGLDRLVRMLTLVPDLHLVIAGNDVAGHRGELEALAATLGVDRRTLFVGPVHGPRKWLLLQTAPLFALPSHNENFGNAVLEAMAAGVPVVVTPQVGLADAVQQFGAGLVVEGAPASLARAMRLLLGESEMRRRMGEAGRRAATEHYGWPAIAKDIDELYSRCGFQVHRRDK